MMTLIRRQYQIYVVKNGYSQFFIKFLTFQKNQMKPGEIKVNLTRSGAVSAKSFW